MNALMQQLKEDEKINFYPWVGDQYEEGLAGKKVLVLGESHYCRGYLSEGELCYPCCERKKMSEALGCFSQTEDVVLQFVEGYEGERYLQTFLCFERAVCGREISEIERYTFWHRLAFYNYVQFSQKEPRQPIVVPNNSSEEAFKHVLETLMPDFIIVWGYTKLWNYLPDWNGFESQISIDNGDSIKAWNYEIKGKQIPTVAVYHPSTPDGKKWGYWHQFYEKIIGRIDTL